MKFRREKKICNNMKVDIDFSESNGSLRSISINSLNDLWHSSSNVFIVILFFWNFTCETVSKMIQEA
jgi:hypothetical protein